MQGYRSPVITATRRGQSSPAAIRVALTNVFSTMLILPESETVIVTQITKQ